MATVDRTDICGGWIVNGLYKGGVAEQAGIEIGDIIVAINNRPVKEITWEEQRKGLELQGETTYTVQKPDGQIVSYTLFIGKQIIWPNYIPYSPEFAVSKKIVERTSICRYGIGTEDDR